MSTSDQNGPQLTRKQLRELRLTGSTPVVDESANSAVADAAPEPEPEPEPQPVAHAAAAAPTRPRAPIHHIVDSVPSSRVDEDDDDLAIFDVPAPAEKRPIAPKPEAPKPEAAKPAVPKQDAPKPVAPKPVAPKPEVPKTDAGAASGSAAPLTRREMRRQERARTESLSLGTPAKPEESAPVASEPDHVSHDDHGAIKSIFESPVEEEHSTPAAIVPKPVPAPVPEPVSAPVPAPVRAPQGEPAPEAVTEAEAEPIAEESRPMVGAAFGIGVKEHAAKDPKLPTAFDELLDRDSAGTTHTSSTLIFTPSPGVGSLSGPIASTGELLVTGSYKLPEGLGSRGHARGTTDGKEVDAVLIDGELAPTSSPTPIAASSAISTLKPAGEVIRPPAPDKSSKLTFTLAIVAGGLGLALAVVIGVAASTGVFS